MEKEKEVRYKVNKKQIKDIIKNTIPYKEKKEMLDITFGYDGFESLKKHGYICRIRQKEKKVTLEVKNYLNKNECLEQSINLENPEQGANYLKLIGMKPYLYLKRDREIRKYKSLKVFIDEFDILGDFIEIEYQDSNNVKEELNEFLNKFNIDKKEQEKYGDIVKEKLEKDKIFKELFNQELERILKN